MENFIYIDQKHTQTEVEGRYESLAELYAEVFAGPPWNESTRSNGCNSFFGSDTKVGDTCRNCGDGLTEAYPKVETIENIKKELSRPNATLATVETRSGMLVGFAWGFTCVDARDFADSKYRTLEMKSQLTGILQSEGATTAFFYFSECGVSPQFRNKGLSNLLASELAREALTIRQPLVMRTNVQSPMVKVGARLGMRQIMGPSVNGIINFIDKENPDRVLFIKR